MVVHAYDASPRESGGQGHLRLQETHLKCTQHHSKSPERVRVVWGIQNYLSTWYHHVFILLFLSQSLYPHIYLYATI